MSTAIVIAIIFGYLAVGWWLAPVMAGKTCARAIEKAQRELDRTPWKRSIYHDAADKSRVDREIDGPMVYALTVPFWPIIAAYNAIVAHGFGYEARMVAHDPALRAEMIAKQQKRIAELERELGIGDR